MAFAGDERGYAFTCDWFDNQSQSIRKFTLTYYAQEKSVEMWDLRGKRMFLKKCPYAQLRMGDLFPGSTVTVFNRQLNITDYGNSYTRQVLGTAQQRTVGIIYSNSTQEAGKILDVASVEGFTLGSLKMTSMSDRAAMAFAQQSGKPVTREIIQGLSGGSIIVFELLARKSVLAWQNLIDMRQWGAFVHGSSSVDAAENEYGFFFGEGSNQRFPHSPELRDCTLCLIKPHVLREGKAGKVLRAIQDAGFVVTAAGIFHLDRPAADEFLEVYQGVLADIEYNATTVELTSGRLLALELQSSENASVGSKGEQVDVVTAFRDLCGPYPVHIAKTIRADSLRAQFGTTVSENAVHCTDLKDDGVVECEYFFGILGGSY